MTPSEVNEMRVYSGENRDILSQILASSSEDFDEDEDSTEEPEKMKKTEVKSTSITLQNVDFVNPLGDDLREVAKRKGLNPFAYQLLEELFPSKKGGVIDLAKDDITGKLVSKAFVDSEELGSGLVEDESKDSGSKSQEDKTDQNVNIDSLTGKEVAEIFRGSPVVRQAKNWKTIRPGSTPISSNEDTDLKSKKIVNVNSQKESQKLYSFKSKEIDRIVSYVAGQRQIPAKDTEAFAWIKSRVQNSVFQLGEAAKQARAEFCQKFKPDSYVSVEIKDDRYEKRPSAKKSKKSKSQENVENDVQEEKVEELRPFRLVLEDSSDEELKKALEMSVKKNDPKIKKDDIAKDDIAKNDKVKFAKNDIKVVEKSREVEEPRVHELKLQKPPPTPLTKESFKEILVNVENRLQKPKQTSHKRVMTALLKGNNNYQGIEKYLIPLAAQNPQLQPETSNLLGKEYRKRDHEESRSGSLKNVSLIDQERILRVMLEKDPKNDTILKALDKVLERVQKKKDANKDQKMKKKAKKELEKKKLEKSVESRIVTQAKNKGKAGDYNNDKDREIAESYARLDAERMHLKILKKRKAEAMNSVKEGKSNRDADKHQENKRRKGPDSNDKKKDRKN